MAISQIRIHGKGHHLCLSRTLQSSLEEERYTDVRIGVCKSTSLDDNNHHRFLRASSAVLAAASPVLAHLLKERIEDDEMVLVFDGYQYQDISNLLQYIYTGQAYINSQNGQVLRGLLDHLHVGDFTKFLPNNELPTFPMASNEELAQHTPKQITVDFASSQVKNKNLEIMQKQKSGYGKHRKKFPVYPSRPLRLPKSEITLKDPLINQLEMLNPDATRTCSMLEKSATKFNLLTEARAVDGNLVDYYPTMANRVGIYFDPQLFNYYRSLVRSLPPIRIFLQIDDNEFDSDSDCKLPTIKKSNIVYPPAGKRHFQRILHQRKSFFSSRLPVKTMCCVNGKAHVILDGDPVPIDPSIKAIDHPAVDCNQQHRHVQSEEEDESSVQLEVENESRRKRMLLSTLNRLRKDHSRAKKVAHNILKVSSAKNEDDVQEDETMQAPKKPSRMFLH